MSERRVEQPKVPAMRSIVGMAAEGCAVVGADRTSMRYRSCRTDDSDLRSRLRELAQQRPRFDYKSSIAICRRYGFIRRGKVTDGARFDGRMLRDVVTRDNTTSADTAYRSRANEGC